ncbi:hypothetical protein [Pseudoalteromonas lipolytica]|uniref:Uncharacterized protein n=1 Tax=Pseudoalteromonas lipolytica TaxID=570156 RepID=A0ABU8SZX3_9GAMM
MAIWQENTGVKPNLEFVDELEWHLNQDRAEPTHFKPLNKQ